MYYVILLIIPLLLCVSCVQGEEGGSTSEADEWAGSRARMMEKLRAYRIKDARVLDAMARVRRHVYIPEARRRLADPYGDHPCPIGHDQTISQPFIVAYMTEKMKLVKGEKVLEIGTGSGYQAAILAEMGVDVYSIEIIPELAEHARKALAAEGYGKVHVLTGDGYKGWLEHSPFDAIIVTCAPEKMPQALVDQLAEGGRMILPLGGFTQRLVILRKKDGKIRKEDDLAVRFVPMVHGRKK